MKLIEKRTLIQKTGTQLHFPFLLESSDDHWFMTYREGPHCGPKGDGDRVQCIQSSDQGKNWEQWPGLEIKPHLRLFWTKLSDGSLVSHRYHIKKSDNDSWIAATLSSGDEGKTWKAIEGPVSDLPFNQDPEIHAMWGHVREGSNGELLCGCYGQTGTVEGGWGHIKFTIGVLTSADRGKSWQYLATICDDQSLGDEGPAEMDILLLSNGDLISVFRTGTKPESPMAMSRSKDGGKTWALETLFKNPGVSPQLLQLENGKIICSYGTRDVYVMSSIDEQVSGWNKPLCLYQGQGTGYTDIQALSANTFRIIFDESTFLSDDESGDHRIVRMEVDSD
jgi:hypothetical protein